VDKELDDSKRPDRFRRHRFFPAVDYFQAVRHRNRMIEQMNKVFDRVDVFIDIARSSKRTTNMTGNPILVVPCGFIERNGPTTITFVGKLLGENEMLAVAHAYQEAARHHLRKPSLL